jgi:hypothetical protein
MPAATITIPAAIPAASTPVPASHIAEVTPQSGADD